MTLTSAASTRSMQKRDDPTNSIGQVDDTGDGSYLPSGTDSSVTAPNADCAECNLPNPLDQPLARLWWTSVDDNDLGQTFLNLSSEECCYDSCQADGVSKYKTNFQILSFFKRVTDDILLQINRLVILQLV